MARQIEIHNPEEIENLPAELQKSNSNLLIFKFSPYCPVSHRVENMFDKWISKVNDDLYYIKINVITERSISKAVAEKFNIQHESPQALFVLPAGKVKWNASHYDITETALNKLIIN